MAKLSTDVFPQTLQVTQARYLRKVSFSQMASTKPSCGHSSTMNTGPGSVGVHRSSGKSCRQIHKDHTSEATLAALLALSRPTLWAAVLSARPRRQLRAAPSVLSKPSQHSSSSLSALISCYVTRNLNPRLSPNHRLMQGREF